MGVPIDFLDCSTGIPIATTHSVDMEPFPPTSGVDIVINTLADLSVPIFGGAYEILGTVAIIPILPPVTVIEEEGAICDLLACPVQAGPNQNLTFILPGEDVDIPGLGLTATVVVGATADTGQEIFCIQTQIPVK